MTKHVARTLMLLAACAAAACSKNETPATPTSCGFTLASSTQAAPAGGGTFADSLTRTSGSCTWTATSNATWLTLSGSASGSDSATLTYVVQTNSTAAARTGTVTVQWTGGSTQITVTQAAGVADAGCTYTVAPLSIAMGVEGGPLSTTVTTTGTGCSWSASADASWLTLTSGGSGTATGTVAYSAAANPDPTSRTGTITVQWSGGNAKVTVAQSAGAAPACVYTLSPTTQDVPAGGGSFTLSAARNAVNGCTWSATTSTSWITLTGTTSGDTPASIAYSASANTGAARTGEITVRWSGGSAQLSVRQAAAPAFDVSFALYDPGRQSAPTTECQITSLTANPTTCTLVATANLPTAIVSYNWTVTYPYGFQRIRVQDTASPTFTFTESCGQFSATDGGTAETMAVQLVVTDAVGNTATVRSGSGNQPALLIKFFNCGIR